MTDSEFDEYLAVALDEIESKQEYLEREFGLGRYERFFVDYEKEELQFFNGHQVVSSFSITPVGSHVPEKRSWRWSWGNQSLPEGVRKKAAGMQQLFDVTGFDVFKQPLVSIDENVAWEFTALSAKLLGSLGAYSMPQKNLRTYVLINTKKG